MGDAHPSTLSMCQIPVTLSKHEIGSLRQTLTADPLKGNAVILFPAELEESSNTMDTRIYVGNLNKLTTQDEINTLFATAGAVSSVELVMDKGTGLSKGFAFVSMPTPADAEKAITMFHDYDLKESKLKVNIAKPKA